MALLQCIQWLRTNIPFLVLALCIAEGVLAFLSMFTFPPLALAMVFVGLLTLAMAPLLGWLLGGLESTLVRLLKLPPEGESSVDQGT
jgi:hypothetical protein